jgi:hypothetical protein
MGPSQLTSIEQFSAALFFCNLSLQEATSYFSHILDQIGIQWITKAAAQ